MAKVIHLKDGTYQRLISFQAVRETFDEEVNRLLTELEQDRASLQRKRRRQNTKPQQAGQ